MNAIFTKLPESLVLDVLSFRADQVVLNLTTQEYIENFSTDQLRELLRKKTKTTADFGADIGESHWKRTDKIVITPLHLESYVRSSFTKLTC